MTTNLRPVDFPFLWRNYFPMNQHRTAAGGYDPAFEHNTIRVDTFDYSRVQVRDQREPLNVATGGDLGDAFETFRYLSLTGSIIAPTGSELEDAIASFLAAFDIEESILGNLTGKGIYPLQFTCPTDAVGYAPYQVEKFMARPAGYPVIRERRSSGLSVPFAVELVCEDPRRYRATATEVTLTAGDPVKPCPNWTTGMGRIVYPMVTMTAQGAGSVNYGIAGTTIIANQGFETGTLDGWTPGSNPPPNAIAVEAHVDAGGLYRAVLYHASGSGYSPEISQVIPARETVPMRIDLRSLNNTSTTGLSVFVQWLTSSGASLGYSAHDGLTVGTSLLGWVSVLTAAAPTGTVAARLGVRNLMENSWLVVDDFIVRTIPLTLDLSGLVSGDVVTVDMAKGLIRKNGAYAANLRTSGVDTFFGIPAGGGGASLLDATNIPETIISYFEARA